MSTDSNVFSQGGGGTQFEFETQTAFLIAMIIGTAMPGSESDRITRYRQQSGSLGYRTDDLYLETQSTSGVTKKTLLQIKHGLIISEKNEVWEKVLADAWKDYSNPSLFDPATDRFIIVKDDLTQKEKRHLQETCDWAKAKTDTADFINEVTRIAAKKEYYDQFVAILGRHGITPTEKEMHGFFRCLDVLEYDFGKLVSVDRASIINLIQLSRSPGSSLAAKDIWDKIYTYTSGADSKGGMLELNSLPAHLTENFNPAYFPAIHRKIEQLSAKNLEIIDVIESRIGPVELPRIKLLGDAKNGMDKAKVIILAGEPGSGKSAIAKKITDQYNGHILVFKADELIDISLTDILHRKGIDLSTREFFNHFPLDGTHIIYVDALEKLLEGNGSAFQHLLKELKKHPDIKLIASCRKSNFHLLEIKYFSDTTFSWVDIDYLSGEEITSIAEQLPELKLVMENKRLAALIRVPKYLDYAYKAIKASGKDFSSATSREFMQDLWDIIVENKLDGFSGGMTEKRRNAFISIAVCRARQMKAFVPAPAGCDPEALELLEKENVIAKSADGKYSPAHDVLEDWALMRHVETLYQGNTDSMAFFSALGSEPAMRRAYRLWVQDAIASGDEGKFRFLDANLLQKDIDPFWKDEFYISVLKSHAAETYFTGKEEQLKKDDWRTLKKIFVLLQTACRENISNSWEGRYYAPTGEGWHVIIKFIHTHFDALPETMYHGMLQLLEDYAKLFETGKVEGMSIREAGMISLSLLEYFKKKETYYYEDKTVLRCLKLAYEFSGGIKEELTSIFEKATSLIDEDDRGGNWIETRYYKQIVKRALDGLTTGQLPEHFPDQLISWVSQKWQYREPKRKPGDYRFLSSPSPEDETAQAYGLHRPVADYGTPSAYKTFLHRLLRSHPDKGIDFIIEFTNQATNKLISSQGLEKNPQFVYPIELPDGTILEVRGIPNFWGSYRGYSGPVPHLIESVLMALERYLVELGYMGESARASFQAALEKLYKNSRSLFITGVLSSVCQAHPELAGKWTLPLFTNMDFIFLDISRFTHDTVDNSVGMDDEYYKERGEANRWKHRRKYQPGLKGLIMEQSLYEQGLAPAIFAVLDKHRANMKEGDLDIERHLDDMDFRKYRVSEIVSNEDGTTLALMIPQYSEEVARQREEDKKKIPFSLEEASDTHWMRKVVEDPSQNDIARWKKTYARYKMITTYSWHEHAPGTLASIGVVLHWDDLDPEEQQWCTEMIVSQMSELISDDRGSHKANPFDKQPVLRGFAALLAGKLAGAQQEQANKLLFQLLSDFPSTDQYYLEFIKALRSVWIHNKTVAQNWWHGLIEMAALEKTKPHHHDEDEAIGAYEEKQRELLERIESGVPAIDIDSISFESHNAGMLANAVRMLPGKGIDDSGIDFVIKVTELYVAYNKTRDRFTRSSDDRDIFINVNFSLQNKIADIIINSDEPQALRLFDHFLDLVTTPGFIYEWLAQGQYTYAFFTGVFEWLFSEAENTGGLDEVEKQALYERFYSRWLHFDEYLSKKHSAGFSRYLLMATKWKEATRVWNPLKGKETFLTRMIEKYGEGNPVAVINLLTYPANELLMPQGISTLVGILKKWEGPISIVELPHIEKFIYRAYENHLEEIISEQVLLRDFLWLIDQLVAHGSSDAYWIREFLISFSHRDM